MTSAASAELEQNAVTAAWVFPFDIAVFRAQDAATATFQATIGNQGDAAIAFFRVAGSRADVGAGFDRAFIATEIRIFDANVRPTHVDAVAVLEQFVFDFDSDGGVHRKALQSL